MHQEVIVFAFGLTVNFDELLEFLFEKLTVELKKVSRDTGHCEDLLKSIEREIQGKVSIDMLHNEYLNFTNYDNPTIHIPSRFYDLTRLSADPTVTYVVNDEADCSPAECVFSAYERKQLYTGLKILENIQKHQQVLISSFGLFSLNLYTTSISHAELMTLITKTVKFSRNLESCRITYSTLSQGCDKFIAEQLNGCVKLRILELNLAELYAELCEGLHAMTSLEVVKLAVDKATVSLSLVSGLSRCLNLREVHIANITLRDCLSTLFGVTRKLPKLELTNPGQADQSVKPATPTELNPLDNMPTDSLSAEVEKEPLNPNTVGAELSEHCTEVPGYHSGFPSLEKLRLEYTSLSDRDVVHLCGAIEQGKLPCLSRLVLIWEWSSGVTDETKTLIRTCCEQKHIYLDMKDES